MSPIYLNRPEITKYTELTAIKLRGLFGSEIVATEWNAMLRDDISPLLNSDPFRRRIYDPRVDIAVGPFATQQRCIDDYNVLTNRFQKLIREMLILSKSNFVEAGSAFPIPAMQKLNTVNQNARCFMAIEIEKANEALKYLMGSIVNATALGRIGIVIAWHPERMKGLLKAREYLLYLKSLDKNTFDANNLIILDKDQFQKALDDYARNSDS